jgi:hypothetical protein
MCRPVLRMQVIEVLTALQIINGLVKKEILNALKRWKNQFFSSRQYCFVFKRRIVLVKVFAIGKRIKHWKN